MAVDIIVLCPFVYCLDAGSGWTCVRSDRKW